MTNVISTMGKNADAPIKRCVNNYINKWKKEAIFACENHISKAVTQTTTQEITKVCVRLMLQEGLI